MMLSATRTRALLLPALLLVSAQSFDALLATGTKRKKATNARTAAKRKAQAAAAQPSAVEDASTRTDVPAEPAKRARTVTQTFAMIKPDAMEQGHKDTLLEWIREKGYSILDCKELTLSKEQAEALYTDHKERDFFEGLVTFATSGPVIIMKLEGEDVVTSWRTFIGATDPTKAEDGTIRKRFGKDIRHNTVHGSDSPASAERELALFF